jgi:hypothetical protein
MFPRKKNPLPVAIVRWLDASTDTDVVTNIADDEQQAEMMVTVGFLYREDKTGYTLVTDVHLPLTEKDIFEYRVKHFIPIGMVHDVSIIRK